jgi:addiction module HigA family antidote
MPRTGSSLHNVEVISAPTIAVIGTITSPARTPARTSRTGQGKPFRRGSGDTTIPSRAAGAWRQAPRRLPPPHPHARVILSVRVPTSQPPERPGQILREEFIKSGRLTQAALAQRMGVPVSKIRGILSGEEGITAETALQLEAALGVEAEFWIRAQFVWDCYRLREVERRTAVLEHEVKGKRSKA